MSDLILALTGIDYSYPDGSRGLISARLAVPRGAKIAVLGANGAGKTTLLLHLDGTLRPQSGRVIVDGCLAAYDDRALAAWRSRVGMVMQHPADQRLESEANDRSDPIRERLEEALMAMGIAHLADLPVHTLSLDQRKRAAIAAAIAARPEVLVLDEPLADLDSRSGAALLFLLDALHVTGTTIVFSTHDVDYAHEWADEVAILDGGRVVAQGVPSSALADSDLLVRAKLRRPFVMEVAAAIGLGETPRSRQDLLAALRREKAAKEAADGSQSKGDA